MKNDQEMYQSVLSKRNEHRKKKERQLRIIKRTLPALACFCLSAGLWAAFRERPEKLPAISDSQGMTEATTTATAVTASTAVNVSTSAATTVSASKTTITASTGTGRTTKTTAAVTETAAGTQTQQTTAQQTETKPTSTAATVTSTVTSTAATTSVTTSFGDMSIDPTPPDKRIYPLQFDDMEAAVNAVLHPDIVLAYDDAESAAVYSGMFERFRDEGFICRVQENENIEILEGNGVLLHPSTQKEDTGVSYLVKYKGNNYRVRFFSVDPDISDGTNGIAEYLRERTGREETMNMSMNGQYITIYTADHRQWFMSAFIDSGHYFDISTLATVEDFISFLTEFSYEKIDLEQ